MFLNIWRLSFLSIWLSLFPTNFSGERVLPLEATETLVVPTVPPFPRIFFRETYGSEGKPIEAWS